MLRGACRDSAAVGAFCDRQVVRRPALVKRRAGSRIVRDSRDRAGKCRSRGARIALRVNQHGRFTAGLVYEFTPQAGGQTGELCVAVAPTDASVYLLAGTASPPPPNRAAPVVANCWYNGAAGVVKVSTAILEPADCIVRGDVGIEWRMSRTNTGITGYYGETSPQSPYPHV
jgi:hypothetical protein